MGGFAQLFHTPGGIPANEASVVVHDGQPVAIGRLPTRLPPEGETVPSAQPPVPAAPAGPILPAPQPTAPAYMPRLTGNAKSPVTPR
jgi:hypothetical protein